MTSIPLTRLKAHLSDVVRGVQHDGEPVTITVGGRPAAEIHPLRGVSTAPTAAELAQVAALLRVVDAVTDEDDAPADAVALVRDGRR